MAQEIKAIMGDAVFQGERQRVKSGRCGWLAMGKNARWDAPPGPSQHHHEGVEKKAIEGLAIDGVK